MWFKAWLSSALCLATLALGASKVDDAGNNIKSIGVCFSVHELERYLGQRVIADNGNFTAAHAHSTTGSQPKAETVDPHATVRGLTLRIYSLTWTLICRVVGTTSVEMRWSGPIRMYK